MLILGDLNIHWDSPNDPGRKHLLDKLRSANLVQHVREGTNNLGHFLYLVITCEDNDFVKHVCMSSLILDHFLVNIDFSLQKPVLPTKTITYRKYCSIDQAALVADLNVSLLVSNRPDDLEQLVDLYHVTLRNIIDKHAPIMKKLMTQRSLVPWYNKDIQAAKRHRRNCERLWTRTGLFTLK